MTFAPADDDDYYDDYDERLLEQLASSPSSPPSPPANDPVRPNHYKNCSNGAQVADICDRLDWNRGSAVKYIARAGEKVEPGEASIDAEIRDLNKAKWHVDRRLALVRGELEADSDPAVARNRETLEAISIIEKHWGQHSGLADTMAHLRQMLTS